MAAKKCMVFETLGSVKGMTVQEGASDGLMRISGVFGVCGVKNGNNRIYDKANYAKMVEALQKQILSEGCPGELEHPNSMNIDLNNVSHKIESIEMNEDGTITGTVVLLNTRKGKDAQAMIEGGLPLYISSRGAGSIDESGHVVLSTIKTYDLVGTPGFSQAKLTLKKNQSFESLNESLEDGNIMYAIVENDDDDLLFGDDDDEKKDKKDKKDKEEKKDKEDKEDKKDDSSEDKEDKKDDKSSEEKKDKKDDDSSEDKEDKKDDDSSDEEKKDKEEKKEKKDEKPSNDNNDKKDNKDTNKTSMDELKNSIDKLTERITSLEAGLHVAKESLAAKAKEIEYLKEALEIKEDEITGLNECLDKVEDKLSKLESVDYSEIKDWVNEEFAPKFKDEIMDESLNEAKSWVTNEFASSVESWINEEYTNEVHNWVIEEFAPGVQEWITEEFSPVVEDWINEDFGTEIKEWVCNDFANTVEGWINEEFAPQIEGWICEEFAPQLEGWVNEEFAPEQENKINENLSAYMEAQKQSKYDSIDKMLEALESSKNDVTAQQALASISQDKYTGNPVVESMPAEYKPLWEMLNEERKDEILRQSRAYDFTKKGVMESFWASIKFENNKSNEPVNENLQPTYHNNVIAQMMRLRH